MLIALLCCKLAPLARRKPCHDGASEVRSFVQAGLSDLLGLAGTGNIQVSSTPCVLHLQCSIQPQRIFFVVSIAVPRALKTLGKKCQLSACRVRTRRS